MNALSKSDQAALKENPLRIAVVGPTNVGKTSLVRTLADDPEFGDVEDEPDVTKTASPKNFLLPGTSIAAVKIYDTPGLTVTDALADLVQAIQLGQTMQEIARSMTELRHDRRVEPIQRRILEAVSDADVILFVIRRSHSPSEDGDRSIDLLQRLCKPTVVAWHRYIDEPDNTAEWKIPHFWKPHCVDIDARVFDPKSKVRLFESLERQIEQATPKARLVSYVIKTFGSAIEDRIRGFSKAITDLFADLTKLECSCDAASDVEPDVTKKQVKAAAKRALDEREITFLREIAHCADLGNVTSRASPAVFGSEYPFAVNPGSLVVGKDGGRDIGGGAASGALIGFGLEWVTVIPTGIPTAVGAGLGALGGLFFNKTVDPTCKQWTARLSQKQLVDYAEKSLLAAHALFFTGAAGFTRGKEKEIIEIPRTPPEGIAGWPDIARQAQALMADPARVKDEVGWRREVDELVRECLATPPQVASS